MNRHFDSNDLGSIHDAAMESGLANQRMALMTGVNQLWVAGIPDQDAKIAQLLVDLNAMNTAELADASVPFDSWLGNAARLTKALKSSSVFLRYQGQLRERSLNQKPIPDVAALPEAETTLERPERVIVCDDRLPYSWLAGGVLAGRSVVKLEVPRYEGRVARVVRGEPEFSAGTGWVLAPGIVITCRHVIDARDWGETPSTDQELRLQALATRIIIGFDSDSCTTQTKTVSALLYEDPKIDIAVLELKEATPELAPLTIRTTPVSLPSGGKLAVNIIQHPMGGYKRLGFRNNYMTGGDDVVLRYFTDTDPGSSGAPLCDDEWRVIGVHRASQETKRTKFLDATTTFVNVGHQISMILAVLKRQTALWARIQPQLLLVE